MEMGESFNVFGENQHWFQIFFTENPGMAFGFELGGDYGKLALSVFRLLAVGFITHYLYILVRYKKAYGLIASIALIWAGAVGNILDSAFYGLLFTNSHHAGGVATWASSGDGYATFLHGSVVDMFYFPLVEGHYPEWVPWVGGKHFQFFQPIFNVADVSISTGVLLILVFYQRFFNDLAQLRKLKTTSSTKEATAVAHPKTTDEEKERSEQKLEGTQNAVATTNEQITVSAQTEEGLEIPLEDIDIDADFINPDPKDS